MRHFVLVAVLAIGGAAGVLACGGPPRPPMVPDDNADGGADTPTITAPAPLAPPKVK